MPRGYLKDHPAADYLRYRQFLAGAEYPADFATSPKFYPELLRVFRAVLPLVRFLNTPLRAASPWEQAPREPRRTERRPPAAAAMW